MKGMLEKQTITQENPYGRDLQFLKQEEVLTPWRSLRESREFLDGHESNGGMDV